MSAIAVLQVGIAENAVCVAHDQSASAVPAPTEAHHGGHESPPDETPAPDCDSSRTDCCAAMASCSLEFGAPDVVDAPARPCSDAVIAAPSASRLFSIVTAPEPPPPKA